MEDNTVNTENKKTKKTNAKFLAIMGLIFCAVFLLEIPFLNLIVLLLFFMPPFGLLPFFVPIAAITLGISGIVEYKADGRKKYLILNIINFVIPILAILILIVLFSTRVLVIRFM